MAIIWWLQQCIVDLYAHIQAAYDMHSMRPIIIILYEV